MTTLKTIPVGSRFAMPRSCNVNKLPAHPNRLLIADDEHLVATGLATNLQTLGYEVVGPVADGADAIELCKTDAPDMALLDVRMSKIDGIEAGEVLFRQLGIPVVIFSAYSDPEYVDAGNRAGIFGYLLKPVAADHLRVGIGLAWGRYLEHMQQVSEIANLRKRLEDRKIIEQAKWVLVEQRDLSEPEAMKALQREARNTRRQLVDVARGVIEDPRLGQ